MKKITRTRLVYDLLSRKSNAFPATIVGLVEISNFRAKMDGTPNPYWKAHKEGRLLKRSEVNGFLNWTYANSVNNQRDREQQPLTPDGDVEHFVPMPRIWGHRVKGTPFVRHTIKKTGEKRVYLELKVERSLQYRYELDGKPIANELVEPFIAEKKESSRQGTKKRIYCRDYQVKNVLQITYDRQTYVMTAA